MKALVVDDAAARLVQRELPPPQPGPADLLVRVHMVGVNRADLALSKHHTANPLGIAGSELVGEVIAIGEACNGHAVGDRVMALSTACAAELVCVDHRLAVRIPAALDWARACALPAWYMTAHNALVAEGGLQAGEAVLIQGATSGVGIATMQLARLFGAGMVIGVARSVDKLSALAAQGLDRWLGADTSWPAAVLEATAGRGVELIIDMVGAGALDGHLRCAGVRGRLVAVGRLGGASDALDIATLAAKRLRLIGVTFRSRDVDEKAAIARAFETSVLPAVVDGRIKPLIDRVFPLEQAADAYSHVRANAHIGKVLLEVR